MITKKEDGTYYVAVGNTPTDKLRIEYIDDKKYKETLKTEEADPENWTKNTYSVDKLFSFESTSELWKAQTLLNTIWDDIKDFEKNPNNTNKTEYLQFLSAASNIIDNDWFINDKEINTAITYLQQLLPNSSNKFDELYTYLNSSDWYTKSFAVDRLKQIFAKDAWYSWKSLSYILANHSGWETVTWPSGTPLPRDLIDEFKTQRKERQNSPAQYNDAPKANPNLLWYTAFYRYAWVQYTNVKFSMTSLGNTSSQVEPHIIKNDILAQNRFLSNLEKNTYEVEQLAISLEQQFLAKWVTVTLREQNYQKTFENIKLLLEWKPITLDSWQKISIDINYVFYLLGECCNESVGIDIKKINITNLKEGIVLPGKYTAEGTPDKIYEYDTQIYSANYSNTSRVIPKEYKVWLKHHTTVFKEEPTARSTSWETKEPGPSVDPNSGDTEWWWTQVTGNIDTWSWNNE